jgi:hypothetical protein
MVKSKHHVKQSQKQKNRSKVNLSGVCTLGAIRTHNLLLRKQLLYPLSYEGIYSV